MLGRHEEAALEDGKAVRRCEVLELVRVAVHDAHKLMVKKVAVVVHLEGVGLLSADGSLVVLRNQVLILHEDLKAELLLVGAVLAAVERLEGIPLLHENVTVVDCLAEDEQTCEGQEENGRPLHLCRSFDFSGVLVEFDVVEQRKKMC